MEKGASMLERGHRVYLVKHYHETDTNIVNKFQVINKDFKKAEMKNQQVSFIAFSPHANLTRAPYKFFKGLTYNMV